MTGCDQMLFAILGFEFRRFQFIRMLETGRIHLAVHLFQVITVEPDAKAQII